MIPPVTTSLRRTHGAISSILLAAVVAMQYEITDHAAIKFSEGFYQALSEAMPVDAAVNQARKTIAMSVPINSSTSKPFSLGI